MFSQQDRDYILEVICKALSLEDQPRKVLTAPFYGTSFTLDLVDGSYAVMAADAIRLCIKDGWSHDPMWMQLLLDIYQLRITNAKIRDIWDNAKDQPPPAADPLDFTILNNSTPFVNRKTLRSQLHKLEGAAGRMQPILVVNGDERIGKSYSTNYIDYFCSVKTSVLTYPIIITPGMELDMGAEEVARDLILMMGGTTSDLPKANTNLKKYTNDLALSLLNVASRKQDQHWLILDNFNLKSLRPDTRDLLMALSESVVKGIFPSKCRLIIIGFDRALLSVEPGKIEEEIVQPCTDADIDVTIDEILKRSSFAVSPAGILVIADFIKANPAAGKDMMPELNNRLRILLYAVIETGRILTGIVNISFEEVLIQMLAGLQSAKKPMEELRNRLKILDQSKSNL